MSLDMFTKDDIVKQSSVPATKKEQMGLQALLIELIPKLKNHFFKLDFEIIITAADMEIGPDTL